MDVSFGYVVILLELNVHHIFHCKVGLMFPNNIVSVLSKYTLPYVS